MASNEPAVVPSSSDGQDGGGSVQQLHHPVIIHKSLLHTDIHKYFIKNQAEFKTRVSGSIPLDSCVFPKSSLTATILDIKNSKEIVSEGYKKELFERLDKSLLMCYSQFVMPVSPLIGAEQEKLLGYLYERYLNENNLKILPFHNLSECVQAIVSLCKVNARDVHTIVQSRHSQTMSRLLHNEDNITDALQEIGISQHEANVLFDGCGSLEGISGCGIEDLLEYTSLDTRTAKEVIEFMENKLN